MKILLHSCCGPCSTAIVEHLCEQGHLLTAYFYNPNIHPYQEYRARRDAWLQLVEGRIPYLLEDQYPLEEWLAAVAQAPQKRCVYCYQVRLQRAAQAAKQAGCDAFTTSLLISPYQKHQLICTLGEQIAASVGIKFYYEDFRPLFREGQRQARELGLYMQKYCACIYSEKERYYKG